MSNEAAFRRLLDATNSHDEELISKAVDEVFHPDVRTATPLPISATGVHAVKEVYTTLHRAFPDLHITVEDLIEQGDKLVSRQTVTGTHQGEYLGLPPTGKSVSYNEVFILRFADGRIVETSGVVDVLSQMKQLGIITEKENTTMDARLNIFENAFAMKYVKRLQNASRTMTDSSLPAATQELVRLRASQINGCGCCTDMHTKDALHAGESQTRLNLVATWREATIFTDAERAALDLVEQGTRIADAAGGVTDETWANAVKHYDEEQLGALVALIADINTWNRINVITRQPAGDYQPGQWH